MSLSFLVFYFLPSHALISHKLGGIDIKLKSYEKTRDQIKRKKNLKFVTKLKWHKRIGGKKTSHELDKVWD